MYTFKVENTKNHCITDYNQLVSLYNMLEFYAKPFLSILDSISVVCSYLHSISLISPVSTLQLEQPEKFKKDVNALIFQLEQIDLDFSLITAKELENTILQKSIPLILTQDDVRLIFEIKKRIIDEFETKKIFILSQTKYYQNINNWQKVIDKCNNLTFDIDESGKCLSFSRYTSCVFHLMRIIEKGVQILGDNLDVLETHTKTWGEIVKNVNNAIKSKNLHKSQRYNETITYLTNIRIAWRNEVMHPKDTYTQEEAIGIYDATKIFMTHLVTEIIN